jgi:hypothetical protein
LQPLDDRDRQLRRLVCAKLSHGERGVKRFDLVAMSASLWLLASMVIDARRQITEWQPVSDDQPVCDECMMTTWQRLIVWDEPRA